MTELYWITRLDGIVCTAWIIFFIVFILAALYYGIRVMDKDIRAKKPTGIFSNSVLIPTLTITLLIGIFVPTTREMMTIYAVGGTVDYLRDNDKAKQLPDKVVNFVDAYLTQYGDSLLQNKPDVDNERK